MSVTLLGCEHHIEDDECDECWWPYPIKCKCGGYLHLEYDTGEDDQDVAQIKCDSCDYDKCKAVDNLGISPSKTKRLVGKTISQAEIMKRPQYDDKGWLRLKFADGTEVVIVASYGSYTGRSCDEYPTFITLEDDYGQLIPIEEE